MHDSNIKYSLRFEEISGRNNDAIKCVHAIQSGTLVPETGGAVMTARLLETNANLVSAKNSLERDAL